MQGPPGAAAFLRPRGITLTPRQLEQISQAATSPFSLAPLEDEEPATASLGAAYNPQGGGELTPEQQSALINAATTALSDSRGLWNPGARSAIDALVAQAQGSPDAELQALGHTARKALDADPVGDASGFPVSEREADALGPLFARYINPAPEALQTPSGAAVASTPDPINSRPTTTAEANPEAGTSPASGRFRGLPAAIGRAVGTGVRTAVAAVVAPINPIAADAIATQGGDMFRYIVEHEDRAPIPKVRSALADLNGGAKPPTDPSPAERAFVLSQFPADIASTLSHYDADAQARIANLVLAFHGPERDALTNVVSRLAGREPSGQPGTLSPSQQKARDNDINALIGLAAQHGVPEPLLRLVDPPPASSPLAAIQGMPGLGRAQESGAISSYDASVAHFVNMLFDIAKDPNPELRPVFETGAGAQGPDGKLGSDILGGSVGTAEAIRFLGAATKALGIGFNPTVVTDGLNEPVVRAVNDAFGVGDTTIKTAPRGRWSAADRAKLLNELNPDAVLSIGQSAANGGAKSLIVPANKQGIPTFAIGDNTDRLGNAQHAMVAPVADNGVPAFLKGVADDLDHLGFGQGRSPLLRRPTKIGFAKFISGPDLVKNAYQAAADQHATFDGRLGASSIGTVLGARNLVDQALIGAKSIDGPSRVPTWLDLVTARAPGVLRQRDGSAQAHAESINNLLQRAQPAETFMGQLAALPFNLSQYSPRDQALQAVAAGYMLGATGFILSQIGTRDPAMIDAVAAISAANAARQIGIGIMAGTERLVGRNRVGPTPAESPDLRPVGHLPIAWLDKRIQRFVATDPAAVAQNTRERYFFNMMGRTTYPPSMAADWAQAVSAELSLHGAALTTVQVADGANLAGLFMVSFLYFRNLGALRVGLDGTPRADPTFQASKFVNLMVDLARIPLGVAGALNIFNYIALHQMHQPRYQHRCDRKLCAE